MLRRFDWMSGGHWVTIAVHCTEVSLKALILAAERDEQWILTTVVLPVVSEIRYLFIHVILE